ncbi:MAG: PQQ-binding-like beta-propeller repeat protein [Acidobacteria bacterium]|nr:PQQ-binding-like beta-propeller repeat protein [Acidobacteriota bacterium]
MKIPTCLDRRTGCPGALLSLVILGSGAPLFAQSEWPAYAADARSTKYSPLDQIDKSNVERLEIVWRWRSIDYEAAEKYPGLRPPRVFETSPLMLGGRVLLSTGLGVAAAADPATGEELWSYDPYEGKEPRLGRTTSRGGSTWTDGTQQRLLFLSVGDLVSLDARSGRPDSDFGDAGRVDMLDLGDGEALRNYFYSSPPLVCGDTVVMGNSTGDAWVRQRNPSGVIRGYDVRTGERLWNFFIIPRPGEAGYETWEEGSADYTGAGNVWTWMSCDAELEMVYAATSTPSNDWYGGHRLGAGLFAESIVALKTRTGERVWHFQAVHHGIWDYDFPAAPVLADVTVDGEPRRILAQPSKQAFLYVLDRVDGEPVWPIVELPVPASDVPGEVAWPTQPHPTWPLPYDLQGLRHDDLIDFTPELRAEALEYVSQYRLGPLFVPPSLIEGYEGGGGEIETVIATIQVPGPVGGSNWNGVGLDPETGILYVPSVTVPTLMGLRPPSDPARSDLRYRVNLSEADGYAWTLLPSGLPITKPPYGRITAIDLNTGEHLWMVPNGEGPRDHPLLEDLDLPWLGQPGRASPLVTKTLLFLADASPDMAVQPDWAGSRMFRAYDKATGERLWEMELPAGVSGAPITYLHDGRQYIVLPLSEEGFDNELLALALPSG